MGSFMVTQLPFHLPNSPSVLACSIIASTHAARGNLLITTSAYTMQLPVSTQTLAFMFHPVVCHYYMSKALVANYSALLSHLHQSQTISGLVTMVGIFCLDCASSMCQVGVMHLWHQDNSDQSPDETRWKTRWLTPRLE